MDNKTSSGLLIFGWIEAIVGVLGAIFFVFSLFAFIYCLFHPAQTEIGGGIALIMMFFSIPAILFLIAGIGIIKSKSWARKVHLVGISGLVSLLLMLLLIFHLTALLAGGGEEYLGYILIEIPGALLLILPSVLFFNWHKPKVRALSKLLIMLSIIFIVGLYTYDYFLRREEVKIFSKNGSLVSQGNWSIDGLTGIRKVYKGGKLSHEETYKDGQLDGISKFYYDPYYDKIAGLQYEQIYKDGQRISSKRYDKNGRLLGLE